MKCDFIVICRSASDKPVPPGACGGYQCDCCGEELVANPGGRELIAAGSTPFCEECGFAIAQALKSKGLFDGVVLGPEALRRVLRDAATDRMRSKGGGRG